MFKKLKQKISEEQPPPVRSSLQPPQQGQSRLSPTGNRSRTSSVTEQQDDSATTPDKELLAGMIAEPALLSEYTIFALDPTKRSRPLSVSVNASRSADGMNGSDPGSNQKNEPQSFAQKLQLRVPSMESLFRSPVKETLFRSPSKESLVRSGSRESLNRIDGDRSVPVFDPPSDIESEAEDAVGSHEGLSKEQLFHRLHRMDKSLSNYRGKYSELVTAYRTVQRDKEKLQSILSQSQDKALKRIGELREELQMDQQAKKHLQEEFDASLEEKDQLISVLQTQVTLLKQRLGKGQMDTSVTLSESEDQSKGQEGDSESIPISDGSGANTLDDLQVRVKRQENLLQRCKEMIRSHKEKCAHLSSEKEALQNQLEERLQELEKMKELHTNEKTRLITQLRDAKNLVEQLEQDKGMVIAETKRQMHETLMMKEEEVSQLRTRVKQLTTKCEKLQEQRDKSEKAAFEQLEKAVSASQNTEEAHRKGKQEMEEHIKAVEQASEEERMKIQKELSRVKQEVVDIMKKSCDERILEMEKLHAETLKTKEQENEERLRQSEEEYQEKLKNTFAKGQEGYLKTMQEKEQQALLALEEMELQKKAIQTQTENQLQEMQQELEECRTRILELESFLAKTSQDSDIKSEELSTRLESERHKHNAEINAIIERHKQELELHHQEHDKTLVEKLNSLKQEHEAEITTLKEKCQQEFASQLNEKERTFQSHVEEMNEKTLEKIDVKQTELEALSLELSEAIKQRQETEEKLLECQNEMGKIKVDYEGRLDVLQKQHQDHIGTIEKEKEILSQGLEKGLKEEINHLKLLLDGKEKEMENLEREKNTLKEAVEKADGELKTASAHLDELHCSYQKAAQEAAETCMTELKDVQEKLHAVAEERNHLKQLVGEQESELKLLTAELDSHKEQIKKLSLNIEQHSTHLNDLTMQSELKINEYKSQVEELNRVAADKENESQKLKEAHNQLINQLTQNMSSREKKIESLQEEYQTKTKSQDAKIDRMKQRIKEMQEASKKKHSEMESKLRRELEKKQLELDDKEKQFNDKMLEMAQASSTGINDALSQLEQNHKEQIVRVKEAHQRELEATVLEWERRLSQHGEELREKHDAELQEKDQDINETKQLFSNLHKEKEEVDKQIIVLKEEKNSLDIAFHELQEKLNQTTAQISTFTLTESNLKSELENVQQKYLSMANDKKLVESELNELKASVDTHKSEIKDLLDKLCKTEEKCQSLETSLSKESATFAKELSDKLLDKDAWYNKLLLEHEQKFENCCREAVSLLESLTFGLENKCNDHMNRLMLRISMCDKATYKLKEPISNYVTRIQDLESQINQLTNDCKTINISLTQSSQQLHEKENVILAMKEELKTLSIEKETLQKEGGTQQKVADEKESCITQLKKELSENINTVTSLIAALKERDNEVNELKSKLENSVAMEEKEKAIGFISSQHNESQQLLLKQIQDLTSNIEDLQNQKTASVKEADKLRNKLDEWKKKAEARFNQNHQTIKDLQNNIEIVNKQLFEKDDEINTVREEFEHFRGNTEKDQASRESLVLELTTNIEHQNSKILNFEAEIAQLTKEKQCFMEEADRQIQQQSIERNHLVEQLSHIQNAALEKDSHSMDAKQQILRLENEISNLKEDSTKKQIQWEQLKMELTESKDNALKTLEEQLTSESTKKIAELKKKAEQKIASVKKQLMSQLEEKEKSKQDLEVQLQCLKEQIHREGQALQADLNQEKEELKKNYAMLEELQLHKDSEISSLRDELLLKEKRFKELVDLNESIEKKFSESEKELSLATEIEAERLKLEQLSSKHQEDLLSLQEQLAGKDSELKACNEKLEEGSKSYKELQILFGEIQSQENMLKAKLEEAEGEIQKLRKEVTKLQKDLRALRKEHNQELDLVKKELLEDAEEKVKYEQEDLELKHNSALKQLMREFNTQMAQKERELEVAVQETIGKAQEVEAEIMQSHHIETTQLHKKIAEKEDDLKRTVKKYEEILEDREEEMTTKVTELEEQLQRLQEEISTTQEEETVEEATDTEDGAIQAQLAKRNTQLNDAKLREQELKEKINTLEDELKNYSSGVFVTPLGTPYKDVNHRYTDVSVFGEPTEFEYLRKVMYEYMMGRETKTMAKVITTVLRFPADQAQKILEKEDSRPVLSSIEVNGEELDGQAQPMDSLG